MAAKRKSSGYGSKKKGGTGGRTPASEPRIQIFSKFGGCDFQLAPREFDPVYDEGRAPGTDQSDLESNLMVIQNNAALTSNNTIQTRQNLVPLFEAPAGKSFTGVTTLIRDRLYAACDDQSIHHGRLVEGGGGDISATVSVVDVDGSDKDGTWTFLGYADDQLVGMTAGKQLWTGAEGSFLLQNARPVPDPGPLEFSALSAHGRMTISQGRTDKEPFRVSILYTRLNRFGPTLPSPELTFYASRPTSEWSGNAYVTIDWSEPDLYDIIAVELYYTEGDFQDPAFLARVNLGEDNLAAKDWTYNWTGYIYDTSMWTVANLTVPTQNYTAGVPASMMAVHDGQVYFWGGEPKERVWIGGNPGNRFSVSTGTGGGFADCEPGVGHVVRDVLKFRTDRGASIVTALCDMENSSKEHRFNLVENNISISNEQSAKGWQAEKVAGTVGCKSHHGAVVAGDGLYTVSRYGLALTTLTMEYNSQMQVEYVSRQIEPVFLKQYGNQLSLATLFSVNGVLYMTFGSPDGDLDNVIFCYDIDLKAWWTYTLDTDTPILNMIHIDHEDTREGIGIVTADTIYLLPTTRDEELSTVPLHDVLVESGELSMSMPNENVHYLSQLEFRFDYFIGELDIEVKLIDQFGRALSVRKTVRHNDLVHGLIEYMRIGHTIKSYKVVLTGAANMRLTHFMAKNYQKSRKVGMVWGFDSQHSHTSNGSVQRTFKDYNDLKDAIIP